MSDEGLTPLEAYRRNREKAVLNYGAGWSGVTRVDPDEVPHIPDGRPSWDEYGMQLAEAAASRADCSRRKVGAALMSHDHSIISVGYNGGPSKGLSCLQGECPRGQLSKEELPGNSAYDTGGGTCVALHAEWNVLLRTDWHKFAGSTLYVTHEPCHICRVLISGTAIYRVVAPNFEWHPHGSEEIR